MIKEILTPDMVEVKVHVDYWQDAIKYAGNLLYKNGYIEECYIDNMINIVKEYGPYIVLLPGMALAHARPEHGAKKIGISLITLDKPVCFGHEQFDPVKVVFALSALDNSSHLELIGEMGTLFEDEQVLADLANSQSKQELLSIIEKATQKLN